MKLQFVASLSVLAFGLASLFGASEAAAQQPEGAPATAPPAQYYAPPQGAPAAQQPDGARFRSGIALGGGGLLIPGAFNFGTISIQGQLGAQINNNFGVYAVPSLDIIFGSAGGFGGSFAIMADYTLNDSLTFGAGFDSGAFFVFSGSSNSVSAGAVGVRGARLHFGWNPVLERGPNGIRRKALVIGADLRLLSGGAAFATVSENTASGTASSHAFVLSPVLTIGYQSF